MTNKELARLVEHANKGEIEAFAQIYNYLAPTVYYVGLRIMKNEYDANDVVQETMLRLHQNLASVRKVEALKSFVTRTAYNICMDILRKSKENVADEDAMNAVPDDDVDFLPAAYLETKEQREYVIAKIQELRVPYRTAIMLFYYQQLSIKEMAKVLDVSESLAKTRLSRAREALKKLLADRKFREVIMLAASLPVLTQILNMDAKAAYSTSIAQQNWASLGKALGYTPEVIAATAGLVSAAHAGKASVGSAAASGVAAGQVLGVALAISLTVGATVYGVVTLNNRSKTPLGSDPEVGLTSNSDIFEPSIGSSIDIEPSATSSPEAETQPSDPTNQATSSLPDSPPAEATTSAGDPENPEQEVPAILENSTDPGGEIENYILHYPAGRSVSAEQILRDTGLPPGTHAEVLYLDQVDFSKANEYAVYIQWAEAKPIAVILIVE